MNATESNMDGEYKVSAEERIKQRALETPLQLSKHDHSRLLLWLSDNPDSGDCYAFFDGRIIDGVKYRKSLISRTACLASIAIDGIPKNWSRWAIENRKPI